MLCELHGIPLVVEHGDYKIVYNKEERHIIITHPEKDSQIYHSGTLCFITTATINNMFYIIFTNQIDVTRILYLDKTFIYKELYGSYIYHDSDGIYLDVVGTCHYYDVRTHNPAKPTFLFIDSERHWMYQDYMLTCLDSKTIFKKHNIRRILISKISTDICLHYRPIYLPFKSVNLKGEPLEIFAQNLDSNHNILGTEYQLHNSVNVHHASITFWNEDKFYVKSPDEYLKVYAYPSPTNMKYLSESRKKFILFMLWLLVQKNKYGMVKTYIAKPILINKILPRILGETNI